MWVTIGYCTQCIFFLRFIELARIVQLKSHIINTAILSEKAQSKQKLQENDSVTEMWNGSLRTGCLLMAELHECLMPRRHYTGDNVGELPAWR